MTVLKRAYSTPALRDLEPEYETILTDYSEDDLDEFAEAPGDFEGTQMRIHPWVRPGFGLNPRSVHIEVAAVDINGVPVPSTEPGMDYSWGGIFDREEFIEAVLLAFPGEVVRA